MNIGLYTGNENVKVRALWEENFAQNKTSYADYYFSKKAGNNVALVMEENGEAVSMLNMCPYITNRGEEVCTLSNIATQGKYRKQGLMEELMKEAFSCMKNDSEPYTLLHAKETGIFEKYGFRCIGTSTLTEIKEELCKPMQSKDKSVRITSDSGAEYLLRRATPEDYTGMADFANAYLADEADLFFPRNSEYYRGKQEELISRNGDLFLVLQEEQLCGVLCCLEEQKLVASELLCPEECREAILNIGNECKTPIMARILNVKKAIGTCYSAEKEFVMSVRIHDDLVIENDCILMLHCGPTGGFLNAAVIPVNLVNKDGEHCVAECETNIEDFTEFLFGAKSAEECFHVFAKSKQEDVYREWNRLLICKKVWLTEE